MAEIGTYVCDNRQCKYTLRLSRDFPVWKRETPWALRTPAPAPAALAFVERYRFEAYCAPCNGVVEHCEGVCAQCASPVLTEHANHACPRCGVGTLSLARLTVF